MTNVADALDQARAHHVAGRLPEAEALYLQVLAHDPAHVNALNSLGALWATQGKNDAAAGCFQRAITLDPRHAEAHNGLGTIFGRRGNLEAAAECFRPRDRPATELCGSARQFGDRAEESRAP